MQNTKLGGTIKCMKVASGGVSVANFGAAMKTENGRGRRTDRSVETSPLGKVAPTTMKPEIRSSLIKAGNL